MSYGNDRYGGDDNYSGRNEGNYSGRNEGNYGGRNEYDDNNNNGGGYGGRQGNNQGGGYDQGNSGYGGQNRRDDDSGYDQRRDELRNHGQSGYGSVFSLLGVVNSQLTVQSSSVAGPGGYGRGEENYGGPGGRLNSNNDYNDGDRYNSGNNDGGYGGGNGRPGHSSGTGYGGVPGGSDDYSSAAHTAAQHAGNSGDANMFSAALGMLSGHQAQQGNIDEDEAVRHHQQFYGGADQPHPASSASMGSAAAMQALKMFNGGGSSGNGGNRPQSQNDFIGLAMGQAAKLFGKANQS
jgi:hypothetical protein